MTSSKTERVRDDRVVSVHRGRDAGGEIVASFPTYAEAERAVDALADDGFPVQRAAIVARDLSLVENVTGRSTGARAAVDGAASGALVGALVGFIFGALDTPFAGFVLAFWGLLLGAAVGAAVGWATHGGRAARHRFESIEAVRAERFDVVVNLVDADEAARIIDEAQQKTTPRSESDARGRHVVRHSRLEER